jgi:hypothetical protein
VSELSSMRGTIGRIRASEHGSTGVAVLSAVGVTLAAIVIGLVVGMAVAPEGFGDDWEAVAAERGISGGSGASDGSAGDDPAAGEPMRYGDDPELDALWDACEGGDLDACDRLYWSSPIGSEYEEFGASCGDLDGSAPVDGCGTEGGFDGEGTADDYGDDPELDALWDACEDGDWDACDDLYWSTPIDSRYEEFGATCGDRVEFGMGDCATRAG